MTPREIYEAYKFLIEERIFYTYGTPETKEYLRKESTARMGTGSDIPIDLSRCVIDSKYSSPKQMETISDYRHDYSAALFEQCAKEGFETSSNKLGYLIMGTLHEFRLNKWKCEGYQGSLPAPKRIRVVLKHIAGMEKTLFCLYSLAGESVTADEVIDAYSHPFEEHLPESIRERLRVQKDKLVSILNIESEDIAASYELAISKARVKYTFTCIDKSNNVPAPLAEEEMELDLTELAEFLSPQKKEIVLKIVEGFTQSEIARDKGVTRQYINQLYLQIVEELRI